MSDSRFRYKPIDLATDAIRLVRLMKGSDYDPIVCELFETFLHQVDGTPYEALSYTWGESQESIEITLCGKRTTIRDNLFSALWHLRKHNEDRLLWIDAICIDQESHLEKGHQVGQMRLIYENAQNVHIWLGKSTEDVDMLMTQMNQLDKRALRRPDYRRNSSIAVEREWPILCEELDKLGASHTFHERRCSAARNLLERPWFRRVWIIQEVFSAKVATVGCGWNTLPTRTFLLIPKLLGLDDTVDKHVQAVLEIMPGYLRQRSWHSQRPTLHTLIRKFVSCEATDPRDRVYALIGISSDAGSDGRLQPDYDEGVEMETVIHRTLSYILSVGDYRIYPDDSPLWDLRALTGNHVEDFPKAALVWAFGQAGSSDASRTALHLLNRPGIDPNDVYTNDEPPLLIMAGWRVLSSGWMEVARILLEHPLVDVNITTPTSLDAPLNRVVRNGCIELVRMLIRHPNIDINHTDDKGKTPLLVATECDVGPLSGGRLTDDMVAALLGHPEVDVNYCGCAALREAHRRGNFPVTAMILQDSRIDISSQKNYEFWWMLGLLVSLANSGNYDILKRILDLIGGLQIPGVERALSSAVFIAELNGHTDSVKLLRERISREPEGHVILGANDPWTGSEPFYMKLWKILFSGWN